MLLAALHTCDKVTSIIIIIIRADCFYSGTRLHLPDSVRFVLTCSPVALWELALSVWPSPAPNPALQRPALTCPNKELCVCVCVALSLCCVVF